MNEIYRRYKVAIDAVLEASDALLDIYSGSFVRMEKEDGSPVTIADLTSSKIINKHLKPSNIPITGEEISKTTYAERRNWEELWCVDPLDGTKEFIRKNGEFVINIAHIQKSHSVFGIIASPIRKEIILGGKEFGSFQTTYANAKNPEKWRKLNPLHEISTPVKMISSRSHYSGNLLNLVNTIESAYGNIDSRVMGSALKFFELVNGRADVYPRFAPTMEWDIAAGQAIYEGVGGQIVNVGTGESLIYNKEDLKNPYFIGFNPALKLSLEFYQHENLEKK